MDSKSLRYFLAITEEENMSKAAERLHMSQPPLSRQLKILEDELGTELFLREHGKLRLTEAGIYLKEKAVEIITLLEKTEENIKNEFKEDEGTVTIGSIETVSINFLPSWIACYHEQFPKITYQVMNSNTDAIMEAVEKGIYDIGIVREPFNSEPFHCIRLPEEPWIVVSPQNYGIDSENDRIDLALLTGTPLILPTRAIHEEQIKMWFEKIRAIPQVVCTYSSLSTGIALVKKGVGLLICPESASGFLGDAGLITRQITNPSLNSRSVVITKKHETYTPAVRNFIRMVEGSIEA